MASQNTHVVQGEGLEPHPQNPASEDTSVRGAVEAAMEGATETDNDELPLDAPEAPEAPAGEAAPELVAPGVGDLEPPAGWAAADQETFRSVDKATQTWLLERDKATRETYEGQLSALQPFEQFSKTWEPYFNKVGKPPAVLMNELVNADYVLRQGSPQQQRQMLESIVQSYGIQLGQPQQPQVPEEVAGDPVYGQLGGEIQRLTENLNQLQGQMQGQAQAMQTKEISEQVLALHAFKTATDEDGKPKYPHYAELEGMMNAIAQDAITNGRQTTLDEVYQQASWAHPDVRTKMQSAEKADAIRGRKNSAAQKAAASKSVSSSPQGSRTVEPLPKGKKGETVRETVERAVAASGGSHA